MRYFCCQLFLDPDTLRSSEEACYSHAPVPGDMSHVWVTAHVDPNIGKVTQCDDCAPGMCVLEDFGILLLFVLCLPAFLELFLVDMQSRLPQRENLKFLVASGKNATASYRALQQVYGEETMSRTQVQVWHKHFREGDGHTPVTDLHRSGRPRSAHVPEAVQAVRQSVHQDCRKTFKTVSSETGLSTGTVQRIIKKDLSLKKKAPKWIPHVLTDEQRRFRMKLCAQNLEKLADEPDLLEAIVTGDESSIWTFDPETKVHSMQWRSKGEPRPQIAMRGQTRCSTMLITFFDMEGMVLNEFVPPRETVTSEFYVEILKRLRERIRRKHPLKWKGGRDGSTDRDFIVHHDNASCHTSTITLAFLGEHNMDLLPHPPYSPDLAPNDYFLYPELKKILRGQNFRNIQSVQEAVMRELRKFTVDQFQAAFHELPRRWTKCLNSEGHYFEGGHFPGDEVNPNIDLNFSDSEGNESDSD